MVIKACQIHTGKQQTALRSSGRNCIVGLLVITVCASGCVRSPIKGGAFSGAEASVSNCLDQYRRDDALILHAQVQDPEYRRISGFPFLRVNRFLSSLRHDAHNAATRSQWFEYLAELDRSARESEWRNLPPNTQASTALRRKLNECRDVLRTAVLASPLRFERLRNAAVVKDNYSTLRRSLGLYPIAAFFVLRGVANLHQRESPYFSTDPASFYSNATQTIYGLAEKTDLAQHMPNSIHSRGPLGVPLNDDAQLAELFNAHSPLWSIAQSSGDDRIGAITTRAGKVHVDPTQATVYTHASYAQFRGKVLLQLNYTVWFPARSANSGFDILAGALDSITWRVTLDTDGAVLLADSMHNCGCYYMAFPSERLKPRAPNSRFEEDLWIPKRLPKLAHGRFLLHLAAGNHYLRQIEVSSKMRTDITMTAIPYAQLKNLPDERGGFRPFFAPDGIRHDSARAERFILWPLGIRSAGAMREFGHHAIAFVGRRHFDDPDLIERYFERAD